MNISEATEACKAIKNNLKKMPIHRRHPITVDWYPKKKLQEANKEVIRRCFPFINKILKEIKSTRKEYTDEEYEAILIRKEFIKNKLEEAQRLKDVHRNELIAQIEALESSTTSQVSKLVFNEQQSMKVIEFLFENEIENTENGLLDRFIELTFDKLANTKTDTYEKILQQLM